MQVHDVMDVVLLKSWRCCFQNGRGVPVCMGVSALVMVEMICFTEPMLSRLTKDKIVSLYKAVSSGEVEFKTEGNLRACQQRLIFL
jgi:hypothetical protein